MTICDLTPSIRLPAVALRRAERLKLPDAIICATTIEHGVKFWTNDTRLATVDGLRTKSIGLK
jgi:predicted nucleic acid-binding protein